jgi:serine/threonine-protein kinase
MPPSCSPANDVRHIRTASELVYWLNKCELLEPSRWDLLVHQLQGRYQDGLSLGKELVRLGWLTPFQLEQLLEGNGELLSLGPYRILDWIGEGGVSQVYKAWHVPYHCVVALKVLRPVLQDDADALQQFQFEIRVSRRLAHPNIVSIVDFDPSLPHFYSMEFVEGIDLGKLVEQSRSLPLASACDYIRQAARGLQHAYECGVVHRDIKPANLLLTGSMASAETTPPPTPQRRPLVTDHSPVPVDWTIKILDMGLARLEWLHLDPESSTMIRKMNHVLGTPDFLAPEQATRPDEVDIRADIYSLGCTLYFLLTGQPPFPAPSLARKLLCHQESEPTPIENLCKSLPAGFPAFLRKMMAKSPADRYRTPASVAAALAPFVRGQRPA